MEGIARSKMGCKVKYKQSHSCFTLTYLSLHHFLTDRCKLKNIKFVYKTIAAAHLEIGQRANIENFILEGIATSQTSQAIQCTPR